MTDLRARFQTVDQLEPPDVWAGIGSGLDRVAPPVIDAVYADSTGRRVRAGAVALAVFVAASAFAWTALRPDARSTSTGPSGPPSWLVDKARSVAARFGDAFPTSAEWALTTSDSVPSVSHDPLYLVVLGGHFIGDRAPAGAALPSGSVLAFTLDPVSHQLEDLSLTSRPIVAPGLRHFRLLPDPSTFARFRFSGGGLAGVLEVESTPPSVCYSPAIALSVVAQVPSGFPRTVASLPATASSTVCDRTIDPVLAQDIIDHPEGYSVRWLSPSTGLEVESSLTPISTGPNK